MDMFYAAVEIRDDPSLADVPIAVGSESGICTTSNYVARKYGVRAAMPGFVARKLCPELIFVPCNHAKYAAVAQIFREIIDTYDPEFESLGLDEAHLDITDYCEANDISTEEEIKALVQKIRDDIKKATQITCSAGIGCNKMIAKICTDLKKPDGQTFMPSDLKTVKEFMCGLPIRKVPYIGKMIELTLNNLGIETVK